MRKAKRKPAKKTAAPRSMATKSASAAVGAYDAISASMIKERVEASKMFGMPTLKVKGKAFAGLFNDAMVFKLKGVHHASALALTGAKLFDPMGGRPMKEWVQVPIKHASTWAKLAGHARDYVSKG
jgi:hypothetical protein